MPDTAADREAKAQETEYGTYVAVTPIDHDGVRAYNPGHPVPVSNVQQYGYDKDGLVAKVGTKAAAAVLNDPATTPAAPAEKG